MSLWAVSSEQWVMSNERWGNALSSSWTKLFAFTHRKYLLFVRIRYGQHDNIATLKHKNPPFRGGILCFKRLGFATEIVLFRVFWGCFYRILQKRKILYHWILVYYNQNFVFLYFCVLHFAMRTCFRSAIETKFHCAHLLAALHFASVFIVYRLFAIETEEAPPNVIVKGHLGIVPFIRFSYFS